MSDNEVVAGQGIPLELKIDSFYSEQNMKRLKESVKQAEEGKLTYHDLIEV